MLDHENQLSAFTPDDLRREVGLLHGVVGFEGYIWYCKFGLFAREVEPGAWVKLVPPTAGGWPLDESPTLLSITGPGWAWYISDRPDRSHAYRGGACLGEHARLEAEAHVGDFLADRFNLEVDDEG